MFLHRIIALQPINGSLRTYLYEQSIHLRIQIQYSCSHDFNVQSAPINVF